jgi:hypothetical protein
MGGTGAHGQITVQSTAAATPTIVKTFGGTNEVDVAGSSALLTIDDNGTDTVKVGTAQTLDPIGSVTVNGDFATTLTVEDQNNPGNPSLVRSLQPSTVYELTSGSLTRTVTYPSVTGGSSTTTRTINFNSLSGFTLNAGNIGANVVNLESVPASTYIVGGTATRQVNVAPATQDLDNIAHGVEIYGTAAVSVFDQLNKDGTALSPNVYTVGGGLTRAAHVHGALVKTNFNVWGGSGLTFTLYTSGNPNQVSVIDSVIPTTILSGAADAITVTGLGNLTLDAHGGTLLVDDRGTTNGDISGTTSTYTDVFTLTDTTVTRQQNVSQVEIIDPSAGGGAVNPATGTGGVHSTVVRLTSSSSGGLTYKNIKSLTLDGGPIDSTFNLQSTASGVPVTITAMPGNRPTMLTTPGGSTVNHFVVGGNGSVKNIRSQLKITAGGTSDTLLVDDSQATLQDKVTVTNGASGDVQVGMTNGDQFFSGGGLDCVNISSLTLKTSQAADDTVHLTPSAVTAFFLDGDASEFVAGHGAALSLDLTGLSTALLTRGSAGAGVWTFGGLRQAVSFQNMQ